MKTMNKKLRRKIKGKIWEVDLATIRFDGMGSQERDLDVSVADTDKKPYLIVSTGCFGGTEKEFKKAVREKHYKKKSQGSWGDGEHKYYIQYMAALKIAKKLLRKRAKKVIKALEKL